MRITQKDIENSCYKDVNFYDFDKLNSKILDNFNRKNLNYLNLKQFLNKLSNHDYFFLPKKLINYKRASPIEKWDLDIIRYLLNQSLHYNSCNGFKINAWGMNVSINPNHQYCIKCLIRNEVELAHFLDSDEFFEIFSPNIELNAIEFIQININSKNSKIVHENSQDFKEYAIESVLNIMTNIFPEQMTPENILLKFPL